MATREGEELASVLRAPPGMQERWQRGARVVLRHARMNLLGSFSAIVIAVLIFVAVAAPLIAPYDYSERNLDRRYDPPSSDHFFGTDRQGRDMLSRIMQGSRISLRVGIASVASGVTIALLIALTSGYIGGIFDNAVQRVVDTLLAFPGLVVALFLVAVFTPSQNTVIGALAFTFIAPASRPLRAQVISVRSNVYVEAARAIGCSNIRVMARHILPNVMPLYVVVVSLFLGGAIIVESSLTFLGVGVDPTTPSWGRMVTDGTTSLFLAGAYLTIFPSLAIAITVFAFNMLGDTLRDIWDPRLRGST